MIFNPAKDFNINEDCRIYIYNINTRKQHCILEIEANETLDFNDEEILSNPWIYAYKIQVKVNERYKNITREISFLDDEKIKKIFLNTFEQIDSIDNILTNESILYKCI